MARAGSKSMLTRTGAGDTGGTGLAITGVLDPAATVTAQLITGRSMDAVVDLTPGASSSSSSSASLFTAGRIWYDATAGKSYLAFTRPLSAAATGNPLELDVNPYAAQGYTYAVGGDPSFGMHTAEDYFTLRLIPSTCSRFGTCSGHGGCAADGMTCVCDAGYMGSSCSKCALGFIAGIGPGECVAAPADVSGNVAVRMTLRLALNFSGVGLPGSGVRAGFIAAMLRDLSAASGIPVSRFNVSSLRPGSVVAEITILPPPAAPTASPAPGGSTSSSSWSSTMAGLPAPVLATRLAAMLADPTSVLLSPSASPIISALDASAPPTFDSFAIGGSSYTFTRPLGGGLALSWRPQGADVAFKLAYDGSSGDVWYSAGVNTEPSMVGGDVIVYQPAGLAGSQVKTHVMSGYTSSEVVPVDGAADPASAIIVTRGANGASSIEFTRPAAAGSYVGAQSWSVSDGPLWFVWGVGAPGQASMGRHTNAGAGSVQIDLATGAVSAESTRNMRAAIAHAVCMFIGLCVLAPLGVFAARFGKAEAAATEKLQRHAAAAAAGGSAAGSGSGSGSGSLTADVPGSPLWLRVHRAMVIAAAALSIAGFIAGVVTVNSESKHPQHFTGGPHQRLGFAVIFFVLLQPLAAVFRPLRRPEGQRQTRCRTVWEFGHAATGYFILIGAAAAAFLGFPLLDLPLTVTAAYAMLIAALAAFAMWREFIIRCWRAATAPVVVIAYGAGKGKALSAAHGAAQAAARVRANPMRAAAENGSGSGSHNAEVGMQMTSVPPLPGSPAAVAVANPLQRSMSPEAPQANPPVRSHKVKIMPGLGEPEDHGHGYGYGHGLAGSAGAAAAAAASVGGGRRVGAGTGSAVPVTMANPASHHASAALAAVASSNGRQTRASMTPRLVDKRGSVARLSVLMSPADDAAAAAAAAGAFGDAAAAAAALGVCEDETQHAFASTSHAPLHAFNSSPSDGASLLYDSGMPSDSSAAMRQLRSATVNSVDYREATSGWGAEEAAE